MNCWDVLGIEPSKDEGVIKQTYRQKLPLFHPEDDPEGFRRLREAYEEALRFLHEEEPEEDVTPTGLIIKEFRDIYEDFKQRVNPEAWQEILDREICQQIDTQQEISEKLLAFLMERFYIPHPIWKLLATFFCWEERQETLKEKLPGNFIDFVLNQSTYEDLIRYDLFPLADGLEYDKFIHNFFEINEAINTGETEDVEQLLLETDLLGIEHPDYELLKIRYYLYNQEEEQAGPIAKQLLERYPEDFRVIHGAAQSMLRGKDPDAALPLFEKVQELLPGHYNARVGIAHCYYEKGDYPMAKEKYWELLTEYPYDASTAGAFFETNERLIPTYEEMLTRDPENQEIIYKLASCYHNCRRYDDGRELLAGVVPAKENAAKHHDLYAYALMGIGENEEAAAHFAIWEELEEDRSRVARQLASALLVIGKKEEAWKKCEQYLAEFPEESYLYDVKAHILKDRGQISGALEVIEQGLASNESNLNLLIQKAEIHYDLGNLDEAMESSTAALRIYPYVYSMLLLQMKVFYDVDNYEEVLEICKRVDEYELEEKQTDLYRALAQIGLGRDMEESIQLLEKYLETEPANPSAVYAVKEYYENLEKYEQALVVLEKAMICNPDQIYFRIDRSKIFRWQNRYKEALAELTWVVENRSADNADLYNELGLVYDALDDADAAKASYEKAIEINEYDGRAYGNLAGIFARNGEHEKAVAYYTKQLAIREHPYYYISRGLAYGNLKRTNEEKADYLKTIELDPTYAYAYNNMGVVLHDENCFEEALEYLAKALENDHSILASHQFTAKCLAALGNAEKALEQLDKSIAFFDARDDARGRGTLYREKLRICRSYRRYTEGLALLEEIERSNSGNGYSYHTLAYFAFELYKDDLAKSLFEKALQEDENNAGVHSDLAYFYMYGMKKYSKALKSCLTAVSLDTRDESNHLQLAKIYEETGDQTKAREHYEKALELLHQTPEGDRTPCDDSRLGECFSGLGRTKEALACFQKALARAKDYPHCAMRRCYESYFGLALLYDKLGDRQKAEEYYAKTVEVSPDRQYVEAQKSFLAKKHGQKKSLLDLFRRKKK